MPYNLSNAWNDSATDLWRKISAAYYLIAVDSGYSGIEPNALDTKRQAINKSVIYSAFIAEANA